MVLRDISVPEINAFIGGVKSKEKSKRSQKTQDAVPDLAATQVISALLRYFLSVHWIDNGVSSSMHSVFSLAFDDVFLRLFERPYYPEEHMLWESTVCRKIDTAQRF